MIPPVGESTSHSLIVESLDPNCLMLLIEGVAGAEVEMADEGGPSKYLGTVSIYRNRLGEPMVQIIHDEDEPENRTVVFLAAVKRITVL